jgi:hypothetical protein
MLLAVGLLAACGGGGSTGDNSPPIIASAADNYFPLTADARWVVYTDEAPVPNVVSVAGPRSTGGGTGIVLQTIDGAGNPVSDTVYVSMASGVRRFAGSGADLIERAFDGIELLRLPARAGEQVVQIDGIQPAGADLDGDGRADSLAVRSEWLAVARESVTTPAGAFADCLHTRRSAHVIVNYSSGVAPVSLTWTIDTWFAPHVGPVKMVTAYDGPGVHTTSTEQVGAYRG